MEHSNTQPAAEPGFIELRLRKLEEDVAVIRSNYVTKEDLYKAMHSQTWRLVTFVCGFNAALVGATYYIATHVR
ncbi:hypothetical protein [Pseudoduganella rhizocola]|uniref:hypothetical protein n=1 Tax=Pseudoduganella rhizocola TaxID=3382643 RepID=UPI0038B5D02B